MERDDWFRKTAWTDSDAHGFFERLNRSRGVDRKAQYLRIQAYTLANTRQEHLVRVALDLLQQLFTEFPEPYELVSAHLQAAQCHEQLGDIRQALDHFHLSLDAQVLAPNSDPGTALEYSWFIASNGIEDRYESAISTLQRAHIAFPVQLFKAAAVRAFIAQARGDSRAVDYANKALGAADLEQSPFQSHKTLGLIGDDYRLQIERLRTIAAA
jgi:tetratricopeptide (TPR) repeat protein